MNTKKYTQREGKYILGSFSEAETLKKQKNKIIIIMADKNFINRYSKRLCTIKESFQLQVSYSEHTPGNVVEELGSLLSCIIDGIETVPLWKFTESSILKRIYMNISTSISNKIFTTILIGQVGCMAPDSEALLPLAKS